MCGIAGVYNSDIAPQLVYLQIYSLQHRGQESAGISSSDGSDIHTVKGAGKVLEGISKDSIENLKGRNAIGHVRYSTAGDAGGANAQPIVRNTPLGKIAIVHNGNLTNYRLVRESLESKGYKFLNTSDTELFLVLLETENKFVPEGLYIHPEDKEFLPHLLYALREVKGAYSVLMLYEDKLIAFRDALGFRPLLMGKKGKTYFFASESCAFDIVEADILKEVKPGEIVVVDAKGIRNYFPFKKCREARCIFEFVYFARPDSFIFENWVYDVRKELGRQLAREEVVEADLVSPVPDSGVVPALGYAEESGIPFEMGLIRNHYVGRSFIEPTQELRNIRVLMKLSPNRSVIKGKRVVIIDDSLVRGTTSKRIVQMLKRAGAKEVHLRIASPPVVGPCYYGIDTPTKEELIANRMSLEEIRRYIGADSLRYLSLEGLRSVVGGGDSYCDACFSNKYPVEVEDLKLITPRT